MKNTDTNPIKYFLIYLYQKYGLNMKMIQTFWSGYKDPLIDGFGWLSPQYNLMSWTLSCLCLKENYDDVVLYTDSIGYSLFYEYLQLPYKDIIIQYDNLNCHRNLWAYPKLLTYSIQDKPFLHIDGDVYLPNKLPQRIEDGSLVGQNKEIGTSYYKHMMNEIMKSSISIPELLLEELKKDSISSYNAGIIGGYDIKFIKEYCKDAFEFIKINNLNNIDSSSVNINLNILFEQILFYCLVSKDKRKVSTLIKEKVKDNGYSYDRFCNFYSFNKSDLIHVIGGHKRNERICELLSRTLLHKYPEYYKRIIELFPTKHKRLQQIENKLSVEKPISKLLSNLQRYESFLDNLAQQWSHIRNEELFEYEKLSCNYLQFLTAPKKKQNSITINRNPNLAIHEIPPEWDVDTIKCLKDRINTSYQSPRFEIACIPTLLQDGYKEVLINDLCYNILVLLQEQKTFEFLLNEIKATFSNEVQKANKRIYNIVLMTLEYLFYNKLIYIN